MARRRTATAFCFACFCLAQTALAQVSPGQTIGTDEAAIRAALEAAGYTVRQVERKRDGKHEVDAVFDGHALEIDISSDGQITEIELDD